MTDSQTGAQPPDDKNAPQTEGPPPLPEEEPDPVEFLDRVIAFLIIIGPFSYLVAWMQEKFADMVSISVHNMILLAAIIGFLVLVGYASKKVHKIRKRIMS
jgi:hypothetical protein